MRVLRTILGLLLLIIGLPALLVGAGFWAAMQHRDPGGAFSGQLQRTVTSGYAVVVTDADGLLRKDAPFARGGDTRLRLTASTLDGPAFIGIGPADEVARYLDDVPRQLVTTVDLGTGALPVSTQRMGGTRAPASVPNRQSFWLKSATGGLDWHPSALRGRHYSLVIMNPSAQPGLEVTAAAELSPGWLNAATWSLLIFGSLLVMAGIIILAYPGRRREVVYVVEPSQVPDLMVAIGAPLPLSRTGGGRHAGTHRPRTLADAGTRPGQRALPSLAWPPAQSDTANAPVPPGIGAAPRHVTAASSAPTSPAVPASAVRAASAVSAGAAAPPSPAEYAAATAITGPGQGTGRRMPAPGEPLSLIGGVPGKGVPLSSSSADGVPSSPTSAPATDQATGSRPTEPIGRRRAPVPASDTPVFEATAVGAWVAETAASRARETEARAAAVLAAEAAKRAAAKDGPTGGAAAKDGAAEGAAAAADAAKGVTVKEGVAKREAAAADADKPEVAKEDAAESAVGETAPVTDPAVSGAGSDGWSANGLRRADSPHVTTPDTDEPAASLADGKASAKVTSGTSPAPAAEASSTAAKGATPATTRPGPDATPAQSSGPQSTAPAPARPAAPSRPTVPAPARPAPPPRPTPDPTPSRPAAEGPAVSQPTAAPGRQGAPITQPKDGQSQAPVHVSISDRPAVVSQPGSSIPGATAEPPVDIAPRPSAETPRTTTEIQARLQAAMKSTARPSGELRTSAPAGSPSATAAKTTAGVAPSSDAVRVGVAGRRDYPASSRRDNPEVSRSGSTGRPTATPATTGPKQGERESRGQIDIAPSKAAEEITVATKSGSHIAEQRVDPDRPRTDSVSAESGGKVKGRRSGKATKADPTKSAKPEGEAPSVPGARLSAYAEEAAELLAGLSPDRRRRKPESVAGQTEESPSTRNEPAKD